MNLKDVKSKSQQVMTGWHKYDFVGVFIIKIKRTLILCLCNVSINTLECIGSFQKLTLS